MQRTVLELKREYRAHGELDDMEYYIASWVTLLYAGKQRTRRTGEYGIYYLVGLHLKFATVLENGGEHRAHGEQENVEYYLIGLHLKFVLENGGLRTQSTWRIGEYGILSS